MKSKFLPKAWKLKVSTQVIKTKFLQGMRTKFLPKAKTKFLSNTRNPSFYLSS